MSIIEQMQQELQELKESSNLRTLPDLIHEGRGCDRKRTANAKSFL